MVIRKTTLTGANHPLPYPPSLSAYLIPSEGGTSNFFRQHGRKVCSLDYLDDFHLSLSFWFWGGREKLSRVVTTLLGKTRVKCACKKYQQLHDTMCFPNIFFYNFIKST